MRLYWKSQKPDTMCCGQVAVSIILRKSLKETFELFGFDDNTDTKDLIKVLRKNGIKCDKKLRRIKPELGIAKLTYPNTHHWHWVVVHKNKIYDGSHGYRNGTVDWNKKWRMTSYLAIKIKEDK